MKTTSQKILTASGGVIVAAMLQGDGKAQSITLAPDEIEQVRAIRERIRMSLYYARWSQADEVPYPFPLEELKWVSPEELPKHGTYWSRQRCTAPLPVNPFAQFYKGLHVDVYALPDGTLLLDDMEIDYAAFNPKKVASEEAGGIQMSKLRTAEQFAAQTFSVIDTNALAITDTNLYNACISFPPDTNTAATLQIAKCGTNAVIIKANHFDYSAETVRDFALLICDSVDKPVWKSIDLSGASDSQDGWLIQGSVPNWKVTDPMFMLVSNITHADNAFFRAIPYGGPQIQLTGAQAIRCCKQHNHAPSNDY